MILRLMISASKGLWLVPSTAEKCLPVVSEGMDAGAALHRTLSSQYLPVGTRLSSKAYVRCTGVIRISEQVRESRSRISTFRSELRACRYFMRAPFLDVSAAASSSSLRTVYVKYVLGTFCVLNHLRMRT